DPIVTVAAKTHWRSGLALPLVIRLPTGGGVRGGPFHASSPEGWFVGTAGLKVVYPASVEDAYGLLRSAIEDPDPVLYFEHKRLYRTIRGERPDTAHRTPIGAARATGAAGLVLSLIAREAFELLDAPPALHAPPDTPVPFAPELEDAYLPSAVTTRAALEDLLAY